MKESKRTTVLNIIKSTLMIVLILTAMTGIVAFIYNLSTMETAEFEYEVILFEQTKTKCSVTARYDASQITFNPKLYNLEMDIKAGDILVIEFYAGRIVDIKKK